ncbi:unnamed protein product [Aphanomyces euteiches]
MDKSIDDVIRVGDVRRLRDFRTVIKTKNNPLASWIQGTELSKDESMKLFELNENRISWHYGYVSNRFSTDATHVFRVYFFKRVSLENDTIECIAQMASTPFRLVSSRQIRKEAQTVAPTMLSLVDLDKITDDRKSYMDRATNLAVIQTVLMKIGDFVRTPRGIALSSLTWDISSNGADFTLFPNLHPQNEEAAATAITLLVDLVEGILAADFVRKIQSVLAALASCVSSASKLNKAFGGFIELMESQVFTHVNKAIIYPGGTSPVACVEQLVRFLRVSLPAECFVADEEAFEGLGFTTTSSTSSKMHQQEPPYFVAFVAQLRLKFQQSLQQRSPPPSIQSRTKGLSGKWHRSDSNRPDIPLFMVREYAFRIAEHFEFVLEDESFHIYLAASLIPAWTTYHLSGKPQRPLPGHMGISTHVGMNGRTVIAYIGWREGNRVTLQTYMWPMKPTFTRVRYTRHIQYEPETDRVVVISEMEQANFDPICPPVDADLDVQMNYPATYFPRRKYTEYYERDVAKKRKAPAM